MSNNLLNLISKLTLFKVTRWASTEDSYLDEDRELAEVTTGANVSSSRRAESGPYGEPLHALLLDLDVPAYLVPSSTPGHSHLYVDVKIPEGRYFDLLETLADCGVIESGYWAASAYKGGSALRLPWVKKDASPESAPLVDAIHDSDTDWFALPA